MVTACTTFMRLRRRQFYLSLFRQASLISRSGLSWGAPLGLTSSLFTEDDVSLFQLPFSTGFVFASRSFVRSLSARRSPAKFQGSHRTGFPFPRLLFEGLRRHEGFRQLEAYHRPLHSEPYGGFHKISYGNSTVGSEVDPQGRLDGLGGPKRRLPADSHSSGLSPVSQVCVVHRDLPVQGSPLRTDDVPSGVHPGHGSCIRHNASDGLQINTLPG